MDASSRLWLDGLRTSGRDHELCVAALHALLLRVARYEVSRRAGSLQLRGPELEDIAQQASDDALMAIRSKVAGFRGDSRFTTWAYKFVMFEVSTKMGRHFWRHRHASMDADSWERLPDPFAVAPDQRTEHREIFEALRTGDRSGSHPVAATRVRCGRAQRGPDGRHGSRTRRQPQFRVQGAVRRPA